jgi:hypothetical protein
MRVQGLERERVEFYSDIQKRNQRSTIRKSRLRVDVGFSPYISELLSIADDNNSYSPENYFGALRWGSQVKGFRPEFWIDKPTNYPGRGTFDVAIEGKNWFVAFRAFLAHRQKDYETEKQVKSALHVLADYVLLYLPWWIEKNPATKIGFPRSPRLFIRYLFFDRTRFHAEDEKDLGELPRTLNDLLGLRRPTPGSRNSDRIILHKFFGFVLTYFEDQDEFTSRDWVNPIRPKFDNEVSSRPGKTNKLPFSDGVFPFLVHYGQALEAFGEFLQKEAYEKDAFRRGFGPGEGGYRTGEWGYVPVFWYRGRIYHVDWIPSIYLVSRRRIQSNPAGPAGIYLNGQRLNKGENRVITLSFPHLTTVRLLIGLVETGLRGQSLQWLDRRKFDCLSQPVASLAALHGSPHEQTFHSLFVNTDKSHEEWQNLISWRVRRTLLAESYFQEGLSEPRRDIEVAYEDRATTRFAPIVPLFRSDRGIKPISDGLYSSRWVEFLFGFQTFFNSKDGTDRSELEDQLVVLREREFWEDGDSISDIYLAIHTPHACRATYATLKDGDLEVSEISEQLGHSNTIVTNRYQLPQFSRLVAKLKENDSRQMGVAIYDPTGAGETYLHPEATGSPVRMAFNKDRDQALSDFGFVAGVALWSLAELDGDSTCLELLRRSPASAIRWHPTHVCPVGNQCPKEIVISAGAMFRCGICPLAAKCIDHLPAMEAKQTELLERIRTNGERQRLLAGSGAPQTDLDLLHREMQMDTKELLGWKLSAEIVRTRQTDLGSGAGYHVDQPELVRRQLELVTRNNTESEFFLQRISDANAYPSLESPEVRARASKYTRLMLVRQGRFEDAALLDVPAHSELTVFASMLKPFVDAHGLTMEDVALAVDELPVHATLNGSINLPPLL